MKRALGGALIFCGFCSAWAAVEPMPDTPVWYIAMVAVAGFVAISGGNALRVQGGGTPFSQM